MYRTALFFRVLSTFSTYKRTSRGFFSFSRVNLVLQSLVGQHSCWQGFLQTILGFILCLTESPVGVCECDWLFVFKFIQMNRQASILGATSWQLGEPPAVPCDPEFKEAGIRINANNNNSEG